MRPAGRRCATFLSENFNQGSVAFRGNGSDMLAQRAQELAVGDGSLERRRELAVSPLNSVNGPGECRVVMIVTGFASCVVCGLTRPLRHRWVG
jgi:hypothetical protein